MKKNILIFGLVTGAILSINMVIVVNVLYNNPDFESNDFLGYSTMVVILSLIYFGVRNYRNKQLNGVISFGKAFKAGLLIALVASTMYVVVWLFYYYLFVPDFMEVYASHVLEQCTSPDELAATKEEIERLVLLQEELLLAALNLVAPGGQLIYSVCTVTSAETIELDERFRKKTGVQSCGPLPDPWRVHGEGGMILPQDLNSEGMAIFRYQVE